MEGVRLAGDALNLTVLFNTGRAVKDNLLAFHTLIIGPPVLLLADAGVVDWLGLVITLTIAEEANLGIEADSATGHSAGRD